VVDQAEVVLLTQAEALQRQIKASTAVLRMEFKVVAVAVAQEH
jgi:hypothetical protein